MYGILLIGCLCIVAVEATALYPVNYACHGWTFIVYCKLELCSLLCIIRGLLRHVHGVRWPMSRLYFDLEEYLLEQCQMPMSSSRS